MIQPVNSPLSARDARRIAGHAALADAARFLHPVHQALLHRRGWLTMLAPRASGGAELPLPEAVRLEEAVAAIDGSVGWVLTLCAGAGWFAGFLTPELARDIIGTRRVCLGGSGAPSGFADEDGDGYRISGRWDYASGAPMATHFTLNAVLRVDGQPVLDEHGAPRIRAFLVPAAQVQLIASWNSIGMRASASHSYRIDDAWVSKEHGFTIDAASACADGPLYRYPFYSLAYVTLAANVAGMASHFMQLAQECIRHRRHAGKDLPLIEVPEVAALLRAKHHAFDTVRARFYAALDTSWAKVASGMELSASDMAEVQDTSLDLTAVARAAVNQLYPLCGLYAAREDSTINRVWRDFHTASQHPLLMQI
ncbi:MULTISPECIES: acyl-CoA dehydrogenase [unclassified Janthinobacterium]|uniref:acyl-CoA dehydrogenase n=1 Tax=unclassified Janthinobacterium TaxID=2610881 RepID=UPI00160AAFD3|nr:MULTISPECIES: acyl-CoA dehydrogenase [unclassified Janthinobacterium]MBB5610931.1 alkylation response protein AidB-like acyl-CoA dehydrogenase [Janthinobacterium sp. S3T4]MBB5616417.1 alkylation response protein AidB-like acyl-CoA dehydrogenase [Janthinobacterium sp. S3M3]